MFRSRGSAPVDFVLVAIPLVMLSLSILGVSINGYAKNIAQDVAVDAARYAALADQNMDSGLVRAREALKRAIGGIFQPTVQGFIDGSAGNCATVIQITLRPIRLGLLGSNLKILETGTAVCESQ